MAAASVTKLELSVQDARMGPNVVGLALSIVALLGL